MEWTQFFTVIGSILIPIGLGLAAGFGWLIHRMDQKFDRIDQKFDHIEQRINNIETRLTVIETILAMMGAPVKGFKNPKTDP